MSTATLMDDKAISARYLSGESQREIAESLGVHQVSVHRSLRRSQTATRSRARRDQRGKKNPLWVGERIRYSSAHDRVRRERGTPQRCLHCGATAEEKKLEWANVSRQYHDPSDYIGLCVSCHRGWDAKRRKEAKLGN